MSTQTSFDLTKLSHAIRERDCQSHLALYAADAEVEIFDWAKPKVPMRVLCGKPAISEWLHGMSSAAVDYEMRDAVARADRVMYTEVCRYGDGSSVLFECSAEVRHGQIIRAAVALVHVPRSQASPRSAQPATTRRAEPLTHATLPDGTTPRPRMNRQLPGNFLG